MRIKPELTEASDAQGFSYPKGNQPLGIWLKDKSVPWYFTELPMRILAFFFLFAVLQSSCHSTKPGSPHFGKNPDLYGLRFSLIRMDGVAIKAPPGLIHITFESDDNRMSGGAGCNSYAGMWTVHEEMMKLLPLQVTEMVCTEHMELEQRYLAILRETESYSLEVKREGDFKIHTLILSGKGRELAAFRSESGRK